MELNPIGTTINSSNTVTQIMRKMETKDTGIASVPSVDQIPNQVNKTVEISKDPPTTVLKYTNELTKQVELQIPSEVSLRLYKANEDFKNRIQDIRDAIISIKI